ncbi:MAG TPA: hypothetical protein VJK06_06605 [Methyloceanibacter sp.]|nr:hypothetical protein [Methyloceanibacter sp.]
MVSNALLAMSGIARDRIDVIEPRLTAFHDLPIGDSRGAAVAIVRLILKLQPLANTYPGGAKASFTVTPILDNKRFAIRVRRYQGETVTQDRMQHCCELIFIKAPLAGFPTREQLGERTVAWNPIEAQPLAKEVFLATVIQLVHFAQQSNPRVGIVATEPVAP